MKQVVHSTIFFLILFSPYLIGMEPIRNSKRKYEEMEEQSKNSSEHYSLAQQFVFRQAESVKKIFSAYPVAAQLIDEILQHENHTAPSLMIHHQGTHDHGYLHLLYGSLFRGSRNASAKLYHYQSFEHMKHDETSHIQDAQKKCAHLLSQQYKIHLMPDTHNNTDFTPYVACAKKIFHLLKSKEPIRHSILGIKFLFHYGYNPKAYTQHKRHPFVVIYPTWKKEHAQTLLNELYELFKDGEIKGIGCPPRFNASVTDLIYIAQGEGIDKMKKSNEKYFEGDTCVYYNPAVIQQPSFPESDHYLYHPETLQKIR